MATPGLQESLNNVKETATTVNEIIQGLQTPEIIKNIENFRLISQNMNEAATKMQNTMQQLRETGVVDEGTELIKSAKVKINSFGDGSTNGEDLHEVSTAAKEMLVSIKDLLIELKVTVESSKNSGTIRNVKETIKEASDIYRTTVVQAG